MSLNYTSNDNFTVVVRWLLVCCVTAGDTVCLVCCVTAGVTVCLVCCVTAGDTVCHCAKFASIF